MRIESFSGQALDWNTVFMNLTAGYDQPYRKNDAWAKTFRFLLECSISKRITAIGIKQWRKDMLEYVRKVYHDNCLDAVEEKLAYYETEYHNLKEATSLIELASWKNKLEDCNNGGDNRHNKRIKIEESAIREQSRINCGADIVIEHVLPFLLPIAN